MTVMEDCVCKHVGYCDGSCSHPEGEKALIRQLLEVSPSEEPLTTIKICEEAARKIQELERNFTQGFYVGMCEAARTLRVAAEEHDEVSRNSKKILEAQANDLASAILKGWANGLEINAQKAIK